MYTIVQVKKKTKMDSHDYVLKDFKSFYALADTITVPFVGKFSIAVVCDKVEDIQEFIKQQEKYATLMVYIYVAEAVVNYMTLYDTTLPVAGAVNDWIVFKEMVNSKSLLFAKNVMSILYASIEHSPEEMEKVLSEILSEYGPQRSITEEMLSKLFILNKITYPRTVAVAYIQMDRWRQSKLNKCLVEVGNDVILGAIVKNLKAFVKEKAGYYRTGQGSNFIKMLNTHNLSQMYRVFVIERNGLNDVCLLLSLYERGISSNDIIQGRIN